MLRLNTGSSELTIGDLTVDAEDDYGIQTLSMTKRTDGYYYSDVVVPMLECYSEDDLGLENTINTVKIMKIRTSNPTFSTFKFEIKSSVLYSMKKVKGDVDRGMLISGLITDEMFSRGAAIKAPSEYAVDRLGYGVTPVAQPLEQDMMDYLEKHRVWIHSGHGSNEDGIIMLKRTDTASKYRIGYLTPEELQNINVTYNLVFMNTCHSTDKIRYWSDNLDDWTAAIDLIPHKVYDMGTALNAKNYIGWDCSVQRELSVDVPKMILEELNGTTIGQNWVSSRQTVADAVEDVKTNIRYNYNEPYRYYYKVLRCVKSDGQKFDFNKRR